MNDGTDDENITIKDCWLPIGVAIIVIWAFIQCATQSTNSVPYVHYDRTSGEYMGYAQAIHRYHVLGDKLHLSSAEALEYSTLESRLESRLDQQ